MNDKNDIKEEFCGACLAVPLAFLGIGASQYSSKKNYEERKKILLWSGIAVVVSIAIIVYFSMVKKDCKQCSLSSSE